MQPVVEVGFVSLMKIWLLNTLIRVIYTVTLIGIIIIPFVVFFSLSLSSSSVAISHGHHRPAQPVWPFRQHGGVNADKRAQKQTKKGGARHNESATERLETEEMVGGGWVKLCQTCWSLSINNVNVWANNMLIWTKINPKTHTHTHTHTSFLLLLPRPLWTCPGHNCDTWKKLPKKIKKSPRSWKVLPQYALTFPTHGTSQLHFPTLSPLMKYAQKL